MHFSIEINVYKNFLNIKQLLFMFKNYQELPFSETLLSVVKSTLIIVFGSERPPSPLYQTVNISY